MSKEVKRYDPFGYDGLSALMHEDADGGWVRVENYEALRLELTEANADFVRIANEREALIAERDRMAVRLYNSGYMAGHHDTVEGQFTDVHRSEMDTYHDDIVGELLADLQGAQP